MGIFFVLKQKCPAKKTGQALSIQSKIKYKPNHIGHEKKEKRIQSHEANLP